MIKIEATRLADYLEIEVHDAHKIVGETNLLLYAKDVMFRGNCFTLRDKDKNIIAIVGTIQNDDGDHLLWLIFSKYCRHHMHEIHREYKRYMGLFKGERVVTYTTNERLAKLFGFKWEGELVYKNNTFGKYVVTP